MVGYNWHYLYLLSLPLQVVDVLERERRKDVKCDQETNEDHSIVPRLLDEPLYNVTVQVPVRRTVLLRATEQFR